MAPKPVGAITLETASATAYWVVRGLQLALSVVGLGLMSTMFWQFQHVLGSNVPTPFTYNFACSMISIVALPLIILFDLPERFKPKKIATSCPSDVPWKVRWAFDGVLWVFWVAGAATSALHCPDLCAAGESVSPFNPFVIWFAGVICACNGYVYDPSVVNTPDVVASEHWVYQANRGVDIVIVILFSMLLVADPFKLGSFQK